MTLRSVSLPYTYFRPRRKPWYFQTYNELIQQNYLSGDNIPPRLKCAASIIYIGYIINVTTIKYINSNQMHINRNNYLNIIIVVSKHWTKTQE